MSIVKVKRSTLNDYGSLVWKDHVLMCRFGFDFSHAWQLYANIRKSERGLAREEHMQFAVQLDPYKFAWLVIESWPEATVVVKCKNPTPLCKKQLEESEAKTSKSFDRKCYN